MKQRNVNEMIYCQNENTESASLVGQVLNHVPVLLLSNPTNYLIVTTIIRKNEYVYRRYKYITNKGTRNTFMKSLQLRINLS